MIGKVDLDRSANRVLILDQVAREDRIAFFTADGQALDAEDIGATEIARRLGIGRASVYRVLEA